jgi:uncharacterized membrane protein YeaQ/YmgE (transglycosylase-associated protein family)
MPWIVQIIVIGFVVGFIARLLTPRPIKPTGFILTTGLGIAGAFVATQIGRAFGWLESDQLAGAIEMIVGAVIVTLIWNAAVFYRTKAPRT